MTIKNDTYVISSSLKPDQVRDTLILLNRVEVDGSRSHEHADLKRKLVQAEQGAEASVCREDIETLFSFLAKARLTGAEAGRFVSLCRSWQALVASTSSTSDIPETTSPKRSRKKRASQ